MKAECIWVDFYGENVCFVVSSGSKSRTVYVPKAERWRLAEWDVAIGKREGVCRHHALGYYWIRKGL